MAETTLSGRANRSGRLGAFSKSERPTPVSCVESAPQDS